MGKIYKCGPKAVQLRVESRRDIARIIEHFSKYLLITQKLTDYELFNKTFNIIQKNEHLTRQGLEKIVALKLSSNRSRISQELESDFTNIIPVERYSVLDCKIPNSHWLAGFASGEGCFHVQIYKSNIINLGQAVKLIFPIAQHSKDEQLIRCLIKYLNCGIITVRYNKPLCEFKTTKFTDLTDKIIPFFEKYSILGVKSQDFADFRKVAKMVQKNLTAEGLDQIRKIKAGMNKGR